MLLRKWKRWSTGKAKLPRKRRKKVRLTIEEDNLEKAKKPPEWMQELLFDADCATTKKCA